MLVTSLTLGKIKDEITSFHIQWLKIAVSVDLSLLKMNMQSLM